MRHGCCSGCGRIFRTRATQERAARYKAVHDDLQATVTVAKRERHRLQSAHFQQHGEVLQ